MADAPSVNRGMLALLLAATPVAVAQGDDVVNATFMGYINREWGNPYNWDTYEVPNNKNGNGEYAISLTSDCSFFFWCDRPLVVTSPGIIEVTELHVGENVIFGVQDGVFRTGAAEFGYMSQVFATDAEIHFADPEGDYGLLNVLAVGTGTITGVQTEIPNCQSVTLAADGGLVDFSKLEHVSGDSIDATFAAHANSGMIDVRGLLGLDVESTWYAINGGVITAGPFSNAPIRFVTLGEDSLISLPGVSNLDGTELRMTGSGVLETMPITSFDNGTIILESGASYSMQISDYAIDRTTGGQIRSTMSTLSFPNLQTMQVADDVNLTIEASGGLMDFPLLTEIRGPQGRVWLSFGDEGNPHVPQLARVEPTAFVHFSTGSHTVGPIEFLQIGSLSAGGTALVHINGSVNLSGADVSLSSHSTLSADVVTSFDDVDVTVQGGSMFAPSADSCTIVSQGKDWTANGSGSELDLSALENLHVDSPEGPVNLRVTARDGGRVAFRDVILTTAPDDRVLFELDGSDSSIEIGANAVIAGSTYWRVANGAELRVPETVPIAPASGVELSGGVLHLPGLTTFDEAWIGVYASTEFVSSAVDTDLHNTSVTANLDWTFPASAWSWDRPGDWTVFSARRRLDASALQTMSLNPSPGGVPATLRFRAGNRGVLDFSSVHTLDGPPPGSMHVLVIETTDNNALIDFSGLTSATGDIKIDAYRYDSVIDWGTDLRHDAGFFDAWGSSFRNWTEGTLVCRGNVYITTPTRELGPHLSSGRFVMGAPGTVTMELENLDEGTGGAYAWGIQQFEVGYEDAPTRVVLRDDVDNGSRGPNDDSEALYIGKTYLSQPLRIGPGASLVLNGLHVYVQSTQGNALLNTLWPENKRGFPFDQGMLYRVDPDACPADFAAPFNLLDFFDAQEFLLLFSQHDREADLNHDSLWDFFDVQLFLNSFAAGCG